MRVNNPALELQVVDASTPHRRCKPQRSKKAMVGGIVESSTVRPILNSHPKRPTKRSWSRGEWGLLVDVELTLSRRTRARERR